METEIQHLWKECKFQQILSGRKAQVCSFQVLFWNRQHRCESHVIISLILLHISYLSFQRVSLVQNLTVEVGQCILTERGEDIKNTWSPHCAGLMAFCFFRANNTQLALTGIGNDITAALTHNP